VLAREALATITAAHAFAHCQRRASYHAPLCVVLLLVLNCIPTVHPAPRLLLLLLLAPPRAPLAVRAALGVVLCVLGPVSRLAFPDQLFRRACFIAQLLVAGRRDGKYAGIGL
jgi:hypothetical protein